jgi:hypothetical protein
VSETLKGWSSVTCDFAENGFVSVPTIEAVRKVAREEAQKLYEELNTPLAPKEPKTKTELAYSLELAKVLATLVIGGYEQEELKGVRPPDGKRRHLCSSCYGAAKEFFASLSGN